MKTFCGTDIIEIGRIKESIERSRRKIFKYNLYSSRDWILWEQKNAKYYHYAGRFAAKEAIFKAISGLLKNKFDISWHNAQVINDKNGNPQIEFLDIKFDKLKVLIYQYHIAKNMRWQQ